MVYWPLPSACLLPGSNEPLPLVVTVEPSAALVTSWPFAENLAPMFIGDVNHASPRDDESPEVGGFCSMGYVHR